MPQTPNNQFPPGYYYYQQQPPQQNPEPKNNKALWILIALLSLSTIILLYLVITGPKNQVVTVQKAGLITEEPTSPMPEIISKTEEVIAAERSLKINRTIEKLGPNEVKISAKLENIDTIDPQIILNDLSESIKFKQAVEIVEGEVTALQGQLFPPNNKVNFASYGHAPKGSNEKPTKISIVVLDLNFNKEQKNGDLYEITFKTAEPISDFFFAPAEIRSGKFIIELEE